MPVDSNPTEILLATIPQEIDYFAKATAIIDPVIEIDPEFAYAEYFDILVSPNIVLNDPTIEPIPVPEPFPSVPLPAAVWLFGSGLIGLTGIARRKKHEYQTSTGTASSGAFIFVGFLRRDVAVMQSGRAISYILQS